MMALFHAAVVGLLTWALVRPTPFGHLSWDLAAIYVAGIATNGAAMLLELH